MTTNGPSKDLTAKGVELSLDMIFAGVQAVPAGTTFMLDGKTLTVADLAKEVDSRRAVSKTVRDLRSQYRAATRVKRERTPELEAFVKGVEIAAIAALGQQNPLLASFGFKVERKRAKLSSEEKAMRAAKARETREARHTMGAKQKQAIHGEVTEIRLVQDGSDVKSIPADKPKNGNGQ